MATPATAANAYAAMSGLSGLTGRADSAPVPKGSGFGDVLQSALSGLAEQGRATDAAAMNAVSGRADVVDVVTAVAESELALETLVSVRDKVVAAYEEIMRMPI